MNKLFKKKDLATVIDGSNWLIGEPCVVVKVLLKQLPQGTMGPQERLIVVDFPDMEAKLFNNYRNSKIPKNQKKWIEFSPSELKFGHPELTPEQQIEKELKNFGTLQPLRLSQIPQRSDNLCLHHLCNELSTTNIWFNVWGSGYRIPVCEKHAIEYGSYKCVEEFPFKMKEDEKKSA